MAPASVHAGERTDRAALLLPGKAAIHQSLLTFADEAIERRGGHRQLIWWSPPDGDPPSLVAWVRKQLRSALDELRRDRPAATRPLIVGKSLGTLGARVAAELELPAIWLTPLLHEPGFVAEYERATAPCLLAGGTGDPMWDGAVARRLSPHVVEVADADHGMFVPGPLSGSGRAHGEVGVAIERFLDDVVWPS